MGRCVLSEGECENGAIGGGGDAHGVVLGVVLELLRRHGGAEEVHQVLQHI